MCQKLKTMLEKCVNGQKDTSNINFSSPATSTLAI